MKKFFFQIPFLILFLYNPVFAAPVVPATPLPASQESSRIGIVAGVQGQVEIKNQGKVGQRVDSGAPVFLGDTITTDEKGHLQILLLDETVFTIGPNSSIVIDKFVFDPETQNGQVKATIAKGVFRFVTGKIARKEPSNMEVDLPVGTIGIRGTIVGGKVEGMRSLVLLLGPGSRTNTQHRIGSFVLSNHVNGKIHQVHVTRPGYGSVIEGAGQPPQAPFKVPQSDIQQMTGSLQPAPDAGSNEGQDTGNGESATEQAGQDQAGARENLHELLITAEESRFLDNISEQASQDAAQKIKGILEGITTFEELRLVPSGVYHYGGTGPVGSFVQFKQNGAFSNILGVVKGFIEINFSTRTIGGGNSRLEFDTQNYGGNILHTEPFTAPVSFESSSGPAILHHNGTNVSATAILFNHDGVIAENALLTAQYSDAGGNQGTAPPIVLPREEGAAP